MRRIALVFAGGFCGTLARYLLAAPFLTLAAVTLPGQRGGFPYDILLINLTGALAMGLLYGLFERGVAWAPDARLALGTGFLGAYTTFSSLAYGGDTLLLGGASVAAVVYFALSMALGVFCARLGVGLAAALSDRRRLVRRVRARVRATRRPMAHGHTQPHTLHARHAASASGASHPATPHAHPTWYEHHGARQRSHQKSAARAREEAMENE